MRFVLIRVIAEPVENERFASCAAAEVVEIDRQLGVVKVILQLRRSSSPPSVGADRSEQRLVHPRRVQTGVTTPQILELLATQHGVLKVLIG